MERVTLKMIPARKPRIFYGYWIVAVAFFGAFVFGGCSYYVFSLFVKPLQIEFGWGRGEIMIAMTILFLVIGVASPLIGRLVDRYGVRVVVSIGATIAGLGFVLISQMGSLWHFYFGYIVVGVGMAAAGTVPVTALISNWFERRRGMAVGITGMGIGTGGFALTPLFGGYIIPNFGWQMAYIALALITWLLVPVVLLVVRTRPSDKGLYPDGAKASETITETQAILAHSEGLTLKMALVTSGFWLIALSFFLNTLSQDGVIQNQVPHLQDIGFPLAMASGALGTVGLGSLIGKFSFGWVCDRIKPKYAFSIGISLQLAGLIILMNIKPTSSVAMIWLYAITMGLGLGGWLPSISMLISTNFGLVSYGAIFGIMTLASSIGTATGPVLGGYVYDSMRTYTWAFFIFLAAYVGAIVAILAVRRPKTI